MESRYLQPLTTTARGQRASRASRFRRWLRATLSALATRAAGSDQPRIQQHSSDDGTVFWQVYDPVSQQRLIFDREAEVRAWLEQRYNL